MRVYLAGLKGYPYILEAIYKLKIYLAGAWMGNLRPYWEQVANKSKEEAMRIFLAGEHPVKNGEFACWDDVNILESYYYCENNQFVLKLIPTMDKDRLLLDSGAFTFMENLSITVDWDKYCEGYAEFINRFDIKLFVEMDIDVVVGIKEVDRLRNKLERLTGKRAIPIWHKMRGKQYWLDICEEYDYVGIGGIVSKEIKPKHYHKFPWFIERAHERGAKVHGMGFTGLKNIIKYPFDSVDSTAWLYGNRGGYVYYFTGKTIIKKDKPAGTRLNSRAVAMHNFNEWAKFARYMEGKK